MADIIFINRSAVKWNDTYDSYMINSIVGGDTEAGASLTMGSSEILSATGSIVTTAVCTLTVGVAELLASSNSITSSTDADMTLGVTEELTSSNNIEVSISSWITLGLAEDLSTTTNITLSSIAFLTLGVVEVVSSSITTTSVTAGPLLTFGVNELMTSTCAIQTSADALLDLGVSELLASSSSNTSTAEAWLQLGILEPMTATATCVVAETTKVLTLGIETECSAGISLQSSTASLLTIGVFEVLGTTNPIESTVSAAVLTLGITEDLSSTINIVSTLVIDLILGHSEVLTSTASNIVTVNDSGLTIGIQESTGSTGSIVSTVLNSVLTLGVPEPITASISIESSSSSFLTMGVTEVLEATVSFNSFLREGGAWGDLILGIEELLATTLVNASTADATLTLGVDEPLSSSIDIYSNVESILLIGIQELLASTEGIVSNVTGTTIVFGVSEPLAGTSTVVSSASAVTITFGVVETLSASIDIVSTTTPVLTIGITELIASSISTTSTTDSAILIIGQDEILTATGAAIVSVSCNSIDTGGPEDLRHTIVPVGYTGPWDDIYIEPADYFVESTSAALLLIGQEEILTATSIINSSIPTPELTLGVAESLQVTFCYSKAEVDATLILGITEDLSASIGPITTISNSLLTIGIDELLADVDDVLSTNVTGELSLGQPEDLAHTLFEFTSGPVDPYVVSTTPLATMDLGVDEILGVSQSTTSSADAELTLGIEVSLTSTFNVVSTIGNGELILGISEELSDECVSWTSVDGLLTTGILEVMTSTTVSNSVADAELTLGLVEPLAHSITTIPGQDLETGNLFIDGENLIQDENAVHTIVPHGGIDVNTGQYCPQGNSLSSIYFDGLDDYLSISNHDDFNLGSGNFSIDGWYRFDSIASIQVLAAKWAVLNDQRSWILQWDDITETLRFYWSTDGTNSTINFISADWTPSINTWYHVAVVRNGIDLRLFVNGEQIGSTGVLSDTIYNSTSDFTIHSVNETIYGDGYVDNFRLTKSSALWTANFDFESNEDLLYETVDPVEPYAISFTYSTLTLGIDEPLSSTQSIITTTSDSLLTTGLLEVLASSSFSVSVTSADLIIGIEEVLSDTVIAQTSISSILTMGVDEPLSATSTLTTLATSLLDLGDTEYMSVAHISQSITYASLTLGVDEPLTATGVSTITIDPLLTLGVVETTSSSITTVSILEADLTIGIIEELTATIAITTEFDMDITMGAEEDLSASFSIQSVVDNTNIILGVFELLASSSINVATADAAIDLGVGEPMTSGCNIVSNTVGWVTMGIVESLESTALVVSSIDLGISFGVDEALAHTSPYIFPLTYSDDLCEDGTAFGENPSARPPSRAFNNLNTNYAIDAWMGDIAGDSVIGYDFGVGNDKVVQQLKIYLTSRIDKAPTDFKLQGSSSQAGPWTDIHEVVSESWSSPFENKIYTFNDNQDSYQVYRLLITDSSDSVDVEIGELELMENISDLNIDVLSSVADSVLTLGVMEMMTASTDPISTASAGLIDTGVSELLASTDPVVSNMSGNLTLGVPEDLSFTNTTNIIGSPGNLFIDGEGIVEDEVGTHTITNHGNISIDYSESSQGNSSIAFDGDGDYLSIPDSDNWNFGSGDFTIDTWVKFNNVQSCTIIDHRRYSGGTDDAWSLRVTGNDEIQFYARDINQSIILNVISQPVVNDTWYHIAVVKDGISIKLYIDGIEEDNDSNPGVISNSTVDMFIGILMDTNGTPMNGTEFNGNMDNIRVTKGTALWTSAFDIEADLDYPGKTINTYVADSDTTSVLTMGVVEPLTSTINFTTESDGSLTLGIAEILGTSSTNVVAVDSVLTLGVVEPLTSTANIVSVVNGDLDIPGVAEELTSSINIVSYVVASSLDTGVSELMSAFKMIWTQIHTPPLILGVDEVFASSIAIGTLVGNASLVIGLVEVLSSSAISNSVADAELTLGVGEYLNHTVVGTLAESLVIANLSTGDDELLASSISSASASAGELILGLVEVIAASNIVISIATAQIYAGIQEILEGTTSSNSNVNNEADSMAVVIQLRVSGEVSSKGGLFKTT